LRLERKNDGVVDDKSGDDDTHLTVHGCPPTIFDNENSKSGSKFSELWANNVENSGGNIRNLLHVMYPEAGMMWKNGPTVFPE